MGGLQDIIYDIWYTYRLPLRGLSRLVVNSTQLPFETVPIQTTVGTGRCTARWLQLVWWLQLATVVGAHT